MTSIELGTYLKKYREKAAYTQGKLAEELGISRQSIISLETGKCTPSVALALRIAHFFELPVEFIFRGSDSLEKNVNQQKGGEMSRDLLPWSPWREMMSMRETLDRFSEEPLSKQVGFFHPTVGIRETSKQMVVEVDIPGVKEEDLSLEIEDDKLVIRGERKHSQETKKEDYYHLESSYGSFSRVITLPSYVRADKAQAEVKDGLLEISIPKVKPRQPKKIAVKLATKQATAKKK